MIVSRETCLVIRAISVVGSAVIVNRAERGRHQKLFHGKQKTGHEMSSTFKKTITEIFKTHDMPLSEKQAAQMASYYESLVAANARFNLTAITGEKEAALLHFFDSAFAAPILPRNASVIDVGSGAGFPAVPLAIVREDLRVTALESAQKKCRFIEDAAQKAGVRITALCARAEEYANREGREAFDVCVSRAVTALPALAELCVPLVCVDGLFLAYKSDYAKELAAAKNALSLLGAGLKERIKLPLEETSHTVLVFQKTKETPRKYPRRYGQIKKTPL